MINLLLMIDDRPEPVEDTINLLDTNIKSPKIYRLIARSTRALSCLLQMGDCRGYVPRVAAVHSSLAQT